MLLALLIYSTGTEWTSCNQHISITSEGRTTDTTSHLIFIPLTSIMRRQQNQCPILPSRCCLNSYCLWDWVLFTVVLIFHLRGFYRHSHLSLSTECVLLRCVKVTLRNFGTNSHTKYFLWYIWLLPLVLPSLNMSKKQKIYIPILWVVSQVSIFTLSTHTDIKSGCMAINCI